MLDKSLCKDGRHGTVSSDSMNSRLLCPTLRLRVSGATMMSFMYLPLI